MSGGSFVLIGGVGVPEAARHRYLIKEFVIHSRSVGWVRVGTHVEAGSRRPVKELGTGTKRFPYHDRSLIRMWVVQTNSLIGRKFPVVSDIRLEDEMRDFI